MGWVRGRAGGQVWLTVAIAVTVGVVAVVTGLALWPSGHRPGDGGPQARRYLDATACLLTDRHGIVPGTSGAPVWQAMQKASLATQVRVTYLADTGQSGASVLLDTLMRRQCGVIITTGTPAASVLKAAKTDRRQDFVLVAATGAAGFVGTSNAVVVSPAGAPARIDQAIRVVAAQARP
jgi:hypothetical protein